MRQHVVRAAIALGSVLLLGMPDPVGAAPAPEIRFLLPRYFETGAPEIDYDLATGDFNGDGFVDVASATRSSYEEVAQRLPVLLGNGRGGFSAPVETLVGGPVTDLDAADLNGDPIDDLVALVEGSSGYRLSTFVGLGDGTFALVQRREVQVDGHVVAADLDGDGNDDIVFADGSLYEATDDILYVAMGNGQGRFGAFSEYGMETDAKDDVYAADADLDGDLDLVYHGYRMIGRLNLGDGTFGPELKSSDVWAPNFTLGDFDGDGILDVAGGDYSGGHVEIALGNGDGYFTHFTRYSDIGNQVNWTASGDFTDDGKVDVIAAANWDISVLLVGRGNGSFVRSTSQLTAAQAITPVDVDRDGLLDIVALDLAEQVVVSRAIRPGFFSAPTSFQTAIEGFGDWPMRAGDVNGDARPDLVIAVDDRMASHLNRGGYRFGRGVVSDGLGDALSVALADVDEDGVLDVVSGTHAVENVRVALGRGNGSFRPPVGISNGSGASVLGVNVGDFDQDGHLDIVSNTFGRLSLLPGNGDGTFGSPILSGQSTGAQFAVPVADFDGDGLLDAASVNWTGTADNAFTTVYLNLGNGDGTFRLLESIGIGTNVDEDGARAADLDGDGDVDLAIAGSEGTHSGSDALVVLENTGGTLDEVVEFYDAGCSDLGLGDLNGDQRPDATTACDEFAYISQNMGDATFGPALELPAISGQISTAIADFTGDGRQDVVVLTFGEFTLYVNVTR